MKTYDKSLLKVFGYALGVSLLLLASSLLFPACVRDGIVDDSLDESESWVLLTVKLPQPPATATRAATRQADPELQISALRILVLENSGGEYRFSYQVIGNEIEPSGDLQRFRILLQATETPLKLMAIINAEQAFASYSPAVGTPEAAIREALELPFSSAGLSGDLPMYGEALMAGGVGTGNSSISMTALRAIARVDVMNDLILESEDFTLEEVYVYRAYDKIKLIYDTLPDPAVIVVDRPSIPADATFLDNPVSKVAVGGADSIMQIYIPESYAAQTDAERLRGVTVVVVGGRWRGGENPITYYRADFDPDLSGRQLGQVLRNHRYIFKIKQVSAPGWSTPREAADNFASSIVVEVQAWEEFSSEMYFGENRFAVSSREISLRFAQNRLKELDVESTLPYTIQWLDESGSPIGTSTSEQDVTIDNGNFEVTIRKNPIDPETVSHLEFRTLHNNLRGSAVISNRLRITVDNWSVDITVNQDNGAVYSDRVFNVLTGHDVTTLIGNLGTTTTLPNYSAGLYYEGLGMRMILDTHFVPGGSVGIGGFSFEQISDSWTASVSLSVSNAISLAGIDRLLRAQHVIYLTYETEEHSDVADRLMTWLNGSPNRVLIVGTDDANTNLQVRNRLTADGTWQFGISTGSYARAATSSGSDDFFSGPFGEVTAATFTKQDNTAGYCLNRSSDVTPLIMATFNNNAMVFGVNKSRRIIYHGDANLFHPPQLSGVTGAVNSDLDRLMGNVWAWALEQLIYGNE